MLVVDRSFCSGLTFVRFQLCCEKALESALRLAAFCSKESMESLEATYRKVCESNGDICDLNTLTLDDDEVGPGDEDSAGPDLCAELLSQIPVDSSFVADNKKADDSMGNDEATEDVQVDLSNLPDQEQMKTLIFKENVLEPFRMETSRSPNSKVDLDHLPETLDEALRMKGDTFNSLWRLAVRLRSARGGCDTSFLSNPKSFRKASKGLNWHQYLVIM